MKILFDLAMLGAGAYKGWNDATGNPTDGFYLTYFVAGRSALAGLGQAGQVYSANHRTKEEELQEALDGLKSAAIGTHHEDLKGKSALREGVKNGGITAVISGLEIAVGYGVGWVAGKIVY